MSHTTYSLKEAAGILTAALALSDAKLRRNGSPAFMLWGPPGVGKSSIIKQICKFYTWSFTDLRLSQLAPTDLRGLPIVNRETITSRWARPNFLPIAGDIEKMIELGFLGHVIFLDEVNTAPPQTQAAGYQLVLDRAVGEYVVPSVYFPEGHAKAGQLFPIHVLLAGNRSIDKGVTHQMPAPLLNRMGHIEVHADVKEFIQYAMSVAMDDRVTSYLGYNDSSEKLLRLPVSGERSFPTPRSWEMAANAIEGKPWDSNVRALVASFVGEGAATELAAHAEIVSKLPDLDAILQTGKVPVDYQRKTDGRAPDLNIALKWSYVMALTQRVMNAARDGNLKTKHIDNWVGALTHLEPEFAQMGIITPLQTNDMKIITVFSAAQSYREWNIKHKSLVI